VVEECIDGKPRGQPDGCNQDRGRIGRRHDAALAVGNRHADYAAWRVVSALLPGGSDADARLHRIGYLVSAVIYTTFAITAIALARRSPTDANGNKKVTDITSSMMSHTFGRLLIGAIGVIVIAVGLYRLSKGVKVNVTDELDLSGMSSTRLRWTRRLGAIGEIGRGIGIGLVGSSSCAPRSRMTRTRPPVSTAPCAGLAVTSWVSSSSSSSASASPPTASSAWPRHATSTASSVTTHSFALADDAGVGLGHGSPFRRLRAARAALVDRSA